MLNSGSGKENNIENAHSACLVYKLTKGSEDTYDLSFGFHRSIGARGKQKADIRRTKGNSQVRSNSNDVFGFAEHQQNATSS